MFHAVFKFNYSYANDALITSLSSSLISNIQVCTVKICKRVVNVHSYFNLSKIFLSKKQTLARLQFLPQQIPKMT